MFNLENTLTGYTALCFREGPYPEGLCAPTEDGAAERILARYFRTTSIWENLRFIKRGLVRGGGGR